MSVIDNDDVLTGAIKSIRSQVGEFLSDLSVKSGQPPLKAVMKDIQDGVRPPFPYIIVAIDDVSEDGGAWQRHTYVDDQDRIHYVSEERLSLRVTCYGDNATTILKRLRIYSQSDEIRDSISSETGARFIDYSTITRQPVYLTTDFVNAANMTMDFSIVNDWYDPNASSGIIERVTGEASYLEPDSDGKTISVPIDTTSS